MVRAVSGQRETGNEVTLTRGLYVAPDFLVEVRWPHG